MNTFSRIVTGILLALTVIVLVMNAHYLYVAPIANTWTWWPGDETWLMAEYKNFLLTGHYINPLAPGSVYAQSSGLIFGSCYLTAVTYALPLLFIKGHTIDVGRTISWLFSIVTLIALWQLAKRYRVGPVVRAFGVLLLASTLCFFITGHSARSDMLIGLSVLLLVGYLSFLTESPNPNRDLLLGLLLPASLLINGHVLILSFLMIGYMLWSMGILKRERSILRCAGAAAGGFVVLILVQWALLGSLSITGPFTDKTSMMPFARLFHPRAHLTNYGWRIFIAKAWAPGVLWISILIAIALIWTRIRYRISLTRFRTSERQLLRCVVLAVLSSIYIEYYWPRSLIYVLPAMVLMLLILISHLVATLPRTAGRIFGVGLSVCLVFALLQYATDASQLGAAGETISAANERTVSEALTAIHSRYKGTPRIFSTIPGQAIAMDDSSKLLTPVLFDWPANKSLTPRELWDRAKIDYAIVYFPAHPFAGAPSDTTTGWPNPAARGHMIFERTGPFTDVNRPYDPSDLKFLDTLRVYEFR